MTTTTSSFSCIPIRTYTQQNQRGFLISRRNSLVVFDTRRKQRIISCEVALKPDSASVSSSSSSKSEDELMLEKVGARVRVKVPLIVYHVPKVPEVDITGLEGTIKQYVGLWKGKNISANLPFKVEFFKEIEGRGNVKIVAHLKEDEFEYLD
ncbi:hypothetical protein C5167_050665 [Papaver somniferum]|uniref:Ferredoxin thioredoxin reductase alpha chain domain-containing protein n=1 Tax=Papaver somniferum TaxID=3469 RepID=A0A4Y7KT88_PAPSO|nr:ferredoxin-thioredoxin reductase, variable chain-like [Papaver somniferum]RZC75179.1 hypothetical protein C5167_050665 [Papaver somniferum]